MWINLPNILKKCDVSYDYFFYLFGQIYFRHRKEKEIMQEKFEMLIAGAYVTILESFIGRICVANHAQQLGISCHDFINRYGKPKEFIIEDMDHYIIKFNDKVFGYRFSEDTSVTINEESHDEGIQQRRDRSNLNKALS